MIVCTANSPKETQEIAARVAKHLAQGTAVALIGTLGAGKTEFTKGLARALGFNGVVTSPTFNLMNVYEGETPVWHFDLYRLARADELDDIGFYEYADAPEGIAVIEWADKFPDAMPATYLEVKISRSQDGDENSRRIEIQGIGAPMKKTERVLAKEFGIVDNTGN